MRTWLWIGVRRGSIPTHETAAGNLARTELDPLWMTLASATLPAQTLRACG